MTSLIVLIGKTISWLSKNLHFGAGVTWAGEIALALDPKIFSKLLPAQTKAILIAGTNGKTTTAKLLRHILGKNVIYNETGANILNGLVGSLITSNVKNPEYIVLETDEATLPQVLKLFTPDIVVLLNLFRDQLDRYGEVDTIADKWLEALKNKKTTLIINADDPQLAWIGEKLSQKVSYFGLGDKKYYLLQAPHATDSIFCPNCGTRMVFAGHYISHLGEYKCPKCDFTHPKNELTAKDVNSNLEGVYNIYNFLAASLVAKTLGVKDDLADFTPAFGRQEKIGDARILLSKNPAGFNESIRTVLNSNKRGPLLLVLNDRIPDGRDVSWIWDVDFDELANYQESIVCSGDRAYDLGLRLKYAGISNIRIETNLKKAVRGVSWILATYSAMLEVRKILTGKKIL